MKIYLIPGLGADGRMYKDLLHISTDATVLEWFKPLGDESMAVYAARFSRQIKTNEPFALIGTSFGGIMVIELAKLVQPDKLIIISSAKCRSELPTFIRIGKYLSFYKTSIGWFYNGVNKALINILRLFSGKKFLKIVVEMADVADPDFISWAVDKVMKWENTTYPKDIIHIHGTHDLLFPISIIKDCVKIKKGSHMMVMERSSEIKSIILRQLRL